MSWQGSMGPLTPSGRISTGGLGSPGHGLSTGPLTITWHIKPRKQGAKPAGGRLLRKARLRKKLYRDCVSREFYKYISSCSAVVRFPTCVKFIFEVPQ